MTLKARFKNLIDVKAEERKGFLLLMVLSFFSAISVSFFFIAASSHFIKKANIYELPVAYMLSGVVGFVILTLYKRFLKNAGIIKGYFLTLLLYSTLCVLLFLGYKFIDENNSVSSAIRFSGFMLMSPLAALLILNFASLTGRIYSLKQGKRLLGPLGIGEVLANMFAFFSIPFIVKWIGDSSYLLLVSAALIFLCLFVTAQINHSFKSLFKTKNKNETKIHVDFSFLKKDNFYRQIVIASVFSVCAIYFIDYTYVISIRHISVTTGIEIATIISSVSLLFRFGDLILVIFSNNIISKRGMQFAILILPAILIVTSLFTFSSGLLLSSSSLFIFIFILLSKFSDVVVRRGITTPANRVLYFVSKPQERLQVQTLVDGVIRQLTIIVAGLILLAFTYAFSNDIKLLEWVSFISLLFFIGWALTTQKLFHEYKIKISAYLHDFSKSAKSITEIEKPAICFASGNEKLDEQVNFFLGELESPSKEKLIQLITKYHPDFSQWVAHDSKRIKNVIHYFIEEENYFVRSLLIQYFKFLPAEQQAAITNQVYTHCDLNLRLQLIVGLNETNYTVNENELYAAQRIIKRCVAEIIWTEAALHDLITVATEELKDQLQLYIDLQKNLLLEVLKTIFDRASVNSLQKTLNEKNKNQEKEQFAVELLDNILSAEMKEYILPVFEDISFHTKKTRLHDWFPVFSLKPEQRLKEIVMRDFKIIPPHLKKLALENYFLFTGDIKILHAFETGYLENLTALVSSLLKKDELSEYSEKEKISAKFNLVTSFIPSLQYYFLKSGISSDFRKAKAAKTDRQYQLLAIENKNYTVDTLVIAILMKYNAEQF